MITEQKNYQINLTSKQLEVISDATELLSRILNKQSFGITDRLDFKNTHTEDELNELFKQAELYSPEYKETANVAWDIYQTARHRLSWDKNPEGGMTVNFDRPLHTSKEPLPIIKKNDEKGYGIFRIEKLKNMVDVVNSLRHAFRESDTFNADPNKLKDNILLTHETPNLNSVLEKYEKLKPTDKKIRVDTVRCIEVMISASHDYMIAMTKEQQLDYFMRSLQFCNAEFNEQNLLHAQIHYDTSTPHLKAFYIPVIEVVKKGNTIRVLNATQLLGGKLAFIERQTKFHDNIAKYYGLERGEKGSKAVHSKVKHPKLEDGTYCVKSEPHFNGTRTINVVKNQNTTEIEIAMHYPNGEISKIDIDLKEEEIQQLKTILNGI